MTDDNIPSPCPRALDPRDAEALAEIERLKRTNLDLAALLREQGCRMLDMQDRIAALQAASDIARIETAKIISRQQVRIAELEATIATMVGTLANSTPDDDQPATYTHDVPPDAPR